MFAFYCNFLTAVLIRVGMFKGNNFSSGLISTGPSYSATAIAYKGAKIVTISQHNETFGKRLFGSFRSKI